MHREQHVPSTTTTAALQKTDETIASISEICDAEKCRSIISFLWCSRTKNITANGSTGSMSNYECERIHLLKDMEGTLCPPADAFIICPSDPRCKTWRESSSTGITTVPRRTSVFVATDLAKTAATAVTISTIVFSKLAPPNANRSEEETRPSSTCLKNAMNGRCGSYHKNDR